MSKFNRYHSMKALGCDHGKSADQLRHHVLELLQNDYEEAESIILKMIKKSPPQCADFVNLATIYGARLIRTNLKIFLKALAIDSDSAEAKNNVAIALKNKKYSQATSILKKTSSHNIHFILIHILILLMHII